MNTSLSTLHNSNKPTMEIQRLRTLAVEIFKTLNEINPPYMKNIFKPKENTKVRQNDTIDMVPKA